MKKKRIGLEDGGNQPIKVVKQKGFKNNKEAAVDLCHPKRKRMVPGLVQANEKKDSVKIKRNHLSQGLGSEKTNKLILNMQRKYQSINY